jgi:hypothetical protein
MRPNAQRAKNAIIGLYIIMGAVGVLLLGEIYTLMVLTGGIELQYENYALYEGFIGFTAIIYLGAFIGCAIVFIQWFRRAYFNLHQLMPSSKLRYTEGWAAGAWWIPIFNLFGPYQIANDLFRNSEKILVQNELMDGKPGLHSIAGWWWGLWVAQSVLGNISSRMDTNIEIATIGSVIDIIGSFIALGAAYMAVQMIKNYDPMQELLKQVPDGGSNVVTITNDDLLDSGI